MDDHNGCTFSFITSLDFPNKLQNSHSYRNIFHENNSLLKVPRNVPVASLSGLAGFVFPLQARRFIPIAGVSSVTLTVLR